MKSAFKCFEKLRAKAESVGASLYEDDCQIILDAKPGYVWCSTGTTCLVWQYATHRQTWASQAVKDADKDAMMGMERVDDEKAIAELEHLLDAPWQAPAGSPDKIAWPT